MSSQGTALVFDSYNFALVLMKSFCLAFTNMRQLLAQDIYCCDTVTCQRTLKSICAHLTYHCVYTAIMCVWYTSSINVPCNGALFGISGDPTMLNGMSTSFLITACLSDGRATAHTLCMLKVHIVAWSSRQPYYK